MSVETYTSAAFLLQLAMLVLLLGSSTHWAFSVTKEAKAKNSKVSFFMSAFFMLIVAAKLEKIVSLQKILLLWTKNSLKRRKPP